LSASAGEREPVIAAWIASSRVLRTRPVWNVESSGVANLSWSRATAACGNSAT
jgi:hypothetical protein